MRFLSYLNNNTLGLDTENCIGCGRCIEVCPHGVFHLENKKSKMAHKRYCMECGACQRNCPAGAIYVNAGVGCASAVITGILKGSEPVCGCSTEEDNKVKCC